LLLDESTRRPAVGYFHVIAERIDSPATPRMAAMTHLHQRARGVAAPQSP
jgi:hypothetical protein